MAASHFCPHCGALNPSTEHTCFACGQALDAPLPSAPGGLGLLRQRYWLLRQIGAGGFGAVYKAEDTQLGNRLVAVKEMSARGLTPQEEQEATEAFHREALLLARLSHPNLPRIYEQFEEGGRWYLVMDFIEGQTLEAYLEDHGGSLPVKEALQLGLQLTSVLNYLHTRQPPIIFRDLKPGNVMRTPEGQLALIDFGIARLFKPGQQKDTIAFGSPGYAAPEQYGKTQTSPRSDVFSLGALLHQMLTGVDPSETPFRFQPLTMPRPAGLSSLLERMVDIDAEARPATMVLVRQDLERMLNDAAPWHTTDYRVALPGASITPTGATTRAYPQVAPPAPVWPSQATQAGPMQPPPPPPKQKGRAAKWVIGVVLFMVVISVCSALAHSGSSNYSCADCGGVTGGYTPFVPPAVVPVSSLAWSPSGAYLASGGDDGKIQVWDAISNKPMEVIYTKLTQVNALAWSPDNQYLAAAFPDGTVEIWRVAGTLAASYDFIPYNYNINALAWSPDSQRIALACEDGTVRVVDALTGANAATYQADGESVMTVAWSPNGDYIASGGGDQTVQVWDSATEKSVYIYHPNQGGIQSLAWSPDSQRIASVEASGQLQVWDALTGDNPVTYTGTHSTADMVAWSPDGNYLAAAEKDYSVQVWAVNNSTAVFSYTKQSDIILAVAWSSDSQRIASASNDGTVQIWDALDGSNEVGYQQP